MKKNVLAYFLTGLILGALLVGLFWFMSEPKEVVSEDLSGIAPESGGVTEGSFHWIDFFANATTSDHGFSPDTYGYNATSSSATSTDSGTYIDITGAKRATAYFSRTGIYQNEGTSTFHLEVGQRAVGEGASAAATTENNLFWVDYNMLIDKVTNANTAQLTRVAMVSLTGTSTKMYPLDLTSGLVRYVRCNVVETTDGEHSCRLLVQY